MLKFVTGHKQMARIRIHVHVIILNPVYMKIKLQLF